MTGRTPTLRDIATRKVSIDSKPYIGAPERVADELARTSDAVGGDGFAIRHGIRPGYVGPFVDKVNPLLQQQAPWAPSTRARRCGSSSRPPGFLVSYSQFHPGRYIKDTRPAKMVHFIGTEVEFRS